MNEVPTFAEVQAAEKVIYEVLRGMPANVRDRVLSHVQEQLNSERAPSRLPHVSRGEKQ